MVRSSPEDILDIPTHVDLLQDFVTLVNDKVLDTRYLQALVTNEGVHTTGGTDKNVRALGLVLEHGLVLGDGSTTVDDTGANIGHVFGETGVLVANLVGELSGVAENKDGDFAIDGLDLLESGKDEDSGLTHTGLGLADDVHAENGLWNAFLLDYRLGRGHRCQAMVKASKRCGRLEMGGCGGESSAGSVGMRESVKRVPWFRVCVIEKAGTHLQKGARNQGRKWHGGVRA